MIQQKLQQQRSMSSMWGYSGWVLQTLHMDGMVPYWACFAILNIMVRCCLFPVVIYGAHTSSRFAKVVPEVQFLMTLFRQDSNRLRLQGAPRSEHLRLLWVHFKSLSKLYQKYQVNPFSIFLSPVLQLPIFWYFSVDLRKIVNGLDPALAQDLVDSNVLWVSDLTEPDKWFGLPVLAGVLLYVNMEVALGRRTLAGGAAASKADTAVLLKDLFQSLAVFMPCFTSAMPAGMQIYVATTFGFTMLQSELLRTESFRTMVGLAPLTGGPPTSTPPKYAAEFIRLKQLEQKALEIRGSGPLLGVGVLDPMYQGSFPGTNRPSTIQGSGIQHNPMIKTPSKAIIQHNKDNHTTNKEATANLDPRQKLALDQLPFGRRPFVHGVSAPIWQQQQQAHLFISGGGADAATEPNPPAKIIATDNSDMEQRIEKANRGERPVPIQFVNAMTNKPKKMAPMKRYPSKKTVGKQKGSKKKK